jgi:hypothetical protein
VHVRQALGSGPQLDGLIPQAEPIADMPGVLQFGVPGLQAQENGFRVVAGIVYVEPDLVVRRRIHRRDELRAHSGVGETTDQLRTTMAELSAHQRSTTDSSEHWFTLDNRRGPIWGSRGREFKSRQPDR